MNTQTTYLDYELLNQYLEILGPEGLGASVATFKQMAPEYLTEFKGLVNAQNEVEVRRSAHKIKGSCRALGFIRLGQSMQEIERDEWVFTDLPARVEAWEAQLAKDLEQLEHWLAQQTGARD
ncbi:Hpt domain-containing protein [Aliidiomarina sanyensis]|nr:Hpt domain-containing protein [Aliidiomarina sanyensis]